MISKRKIEAYAKKYKATAIRVVSGGGVVFPVFIFIYTAQEFAVTSILKANISNKCYTTEDVCQWCTSHNIKYHVYIMALDRMNPWRQLQYRRIIKML